MKILKSLIAATTITGLTIAAVGVTPATAATSDTVQVENSVQSSKSKNLELSEDELNDVGLTKKDAENLESDVAKAINDAEKDGSVSASEATSLRSNLLSESEQDGVGAQALPVWAAAAIVGCAASVATGEGKAQVKNALKNGGVDEATDIALGIGVDCVFGAVPGGVIGAAAKKSDDCSNQEGTEASREEDHRQAQLTGLTRASEQLSTPVAPMDELPWGHLIERHANI